MKKIIDLKELQYLELDILEEFHSICISNGFRYTLGGGTALGAVRHGGFIPWDDDIDIGMPRPDYNNFIRYCKNNKTLFQLICNETQPKYYDFYAKLINKHTVLKSSTVFTDIQLGVYIDVFPYDGLGDSITEAKLNWYKSAFQRELLVAKKWSKFSLSKTHSLKYEPIRFMFFLLSRYVSEKRLFHSAMKKITCIDFDVSRYAGCVCGNYRLKEILPTEVYNSYSKIKFEGKDFFIL